MHGEFDLFFELVGLQCKPEKGRKALLGSAAAHMPTFCRALGHSGFRATHSLCCCELKAPSSF